MLFEYQPEGEGHGYDLRLLLHRYATTFSSFQVDGYLNGSCMNTEGHAVCLVVVAVYVCSTDIVRTNNEALCRQDGHVPDGMTCRISQIRYKYLKTT